MSSVNAELMSMIICAKTGDILDDDELEEIDERLRIIDEFKSVSAEQLAKKSEIVFTQDHICNTNLKFIDDSLDGVKIVDSKTRKTVVAKNQMDIIKFHTECLVSLEEVNKNNAETEEQEKKRLAANEKTLAEKRRRIERKKYDKLTETMSGASHKKDIIERQERAEAKFILSFGFGFISVMFLGFLTGFLAGEFVL